jgi:hypothetical protein
MRPDTRKQEVSEWADEYARADPVSELLGAAELEEMLVRRRRNVESVAEGIVRRDLYVASPCAADRS